MMYLKMKFARTEFLTTYIPVLCSLGPSGPVVFLSHATANFFQLLIVRNALETSPTSEKSPVGLKGESLGWRDQHFSK